MFDLDLLFQKSELIPVVIQHVDTRAVLMVGFTNREAVERTLDTKTAWFWSRSRNQKSRRKRRNHRRNCRRTRRWSRRRRLRTRPSPGPSAWRRFACETAFSYKSSSIFQ